MSMDVKFWALIARPRSGTNFLRSTLRNCHNLYCFNEVFHSDESIGDYLFFPFLRGVVGGDLNFSTPLRASRLKLWDMYMDYLAKYANDRRDIQSILYGVNYNSLHCIDSHWRNLMEMPTLFYALRKRSDGVIHLVRNNVLAAHVSELRARSSGVWHKVGDKEDVSLISAISIDCSGLLEELQSRCMEIELVRNWLKKLPHVFEVTYEDLIQSRVVPASGAFKGIAEVLGVDKSLLLEAEFVRTRSPSLVEDISNYDQVCKVLKGTPFEWMLSG